MVNPSPYTVGGTVQANQAGLYLSRQADGELLQLCQQGTFAYVLTPRQMGKSSLMIRTAEQLMATGTQAVIIDLTQIGTQVTADEWYMDFLDLVASQLYLSVDGRAWWQAQAAGVTLRLTRFFQEVVLAEVEEPVVIFVDEIDTTLSLAFTDDFYTAIRYLYVARANDPRLRRLSFVLIGVATPGDLIRDPKRTPFNIGQRVDLTDFTLAEALPLAAGLNLPEPEAHHSLEQVLAWTSGHPYLTQRLCQALTQTGPGPWSDPQVAAVVNQTFLGDRSDQDNNLQFVRDMLTKRAPHPLEQEVLTTYRAIYRSQPAVLDEEQNLVKSHLKLSGVVRRQGKTLQVRNPLYREVFNRHWIRQHLPENLWQRLKPAMPVIATLLVSLVGVSALAAYARAQQRQAVEQANIAETERQKAEAALQETRKAEQAANQERQKTEIALKEAEQQRRKAETALKEANRQRQRAEEQATLAQTQQQRAQEQTTLALAQTRRAEQQTRLAQTQTARAEAEKNRAQEEKTRADQQTTIAQLREQAARVLNWSSTTQAVDSLILGIDTLYASQTVAAVRPTAQASLLTAVQRSLETNRLTGHTGFVTSVAFSPDGQRLVSGGWYHLRLWDATTGQPIGAPLTGHTDWVNSVAFSPDGKRLVSGSGDRTLRLWDATTGQPIGEALTGHTGSVRSVAFSPVRVATPQGLGYVIVSGSDDQTLRLWDATTGQPIGAPLTGHTNWVNSVAFSPDGQRFLSGSGDNTLRLWDVTTGQPIAPPLTGHTDWVRSVAFSPDGKRIVSGSNDKTLRLWDAATGQPIGPPLTGHTDWVNSVAFSPDGKRLVSGSGDRTLRLWDATTGQPIGPPLTGHEGYVSSVAFSPDGQRLVSGSGDRTLRLWDATTGQPIGDPLTGHTNGVTSLAFSPDGKRIVSGSDDNTLRLWDATTGQPIGDPLTGHSNKVKSVAFSPVRVATPQGLGYMIVSGSDDNTLRLWDVTTGQLIGPPLTGHTGWVRSVAFSPDGQRLVSGSADNTLRLWDADPEGWLTLGLACNRLRHHPLLWQPQSLTDEPELIAVAQGAQRACREAWRHTGEGAAHPSPPRLTSLLERITAVVQAMVRDR